MPMGKGTYGSKVGRPPKKKKKVKKGGKNNGLSIYKAGRGRNKKAQKN